MVSRRCKITLHLVREEDAMIRFDSRRQGVELINLFQEVAGNSFVCMGVEMHVLHHIQRTLDASKEVINVILVGTKHCNDL